MQMNKSIPYFFDDLIESLFIFNYFLESWLMYSSLNLE